PLLRAQIEVTWPAVAPLDDHWIDLPRLGVDPRVQVPHGPIAEGHRLPLRTGDAVDALRAVVLEDPDAIRQRAHVGVPPGDRLDPRTGDLGPVRRPGPAPPGLGQGQPVRRFERLIHGRNLPFLGWDAQESQVSGTSARAPAVAGRWP